MAKTLPFPKLEKGALGASVRLWPVALGSRFGGAFFTQWLLPRVGGPALAVGPGIFEVRSSVELEPLACMPGDFKRRRTAMWDRMPAAIPQRPEFNFVLGCHSALG